MNYEKLIKSEFNFLKKRGFKIKNYTRNFEIEFNFQKTDAIISINYVDYNNSVVGCGIEKGDKKENILKSTFFDEANLSMLNDKIATHINSAEDQIKIYSQFLAENVDKIMQDTLK